jgi:altronate dehydratase
MGLGGTSEDIFGELAVLLVGFSREQVATFRSMMDDMEADFVPVIPVNTAMLDGTLEAAVSAALPTYQQLPEDTRHAVVMSGMSTAEVMEVIGAYSETASLPESLFGAAVPNNYGSNLRTLLAEMYDDKDYKTTQDTLEGLYQQQ